MSKQSNPAAIGSFVLGAIVLLTLAVMTFGGGELFKKKNMFVTYIDGSVKGLKVGSNVLFRGVRVGHVTEVQLIAEVETLAFRTAVYMEIFPDALTLVRDGVRVGDSEEDIFRSIGDLIDRGLRAQLNTESFVTGQLVVQLGLHPEKPAVFRGVKVRHPEIPSIPSGIQRVLGRIQQFASEVEENLDVAKMVDDIEGILDGANKLVNAPELQRSLAGADQLINSDDTQHLSASLRATLDEVDRTLRDAQALVKRADSNLGPALEGLSPAVEEFRHTLTDARTLLQATEAQVSDNSRLAYRIDRTLTEIEAVARSLRTFLDHMEQHPESLLWGKRSK